MDEILKTVGDLKLQQSKYAVRRDTVQIRSTDRHRMSPKLLSTVLKNIFRKLDWSNFGLNVNRKNLKFADDMIPFEEHPCNLAIMIYFKKVLKTNCLPAQKE